MEDVLNYIIVFFAGAAAGSFFYTLALRYVNGEITDVKPDHFESLKLNLLSSNEYIIKIKTNA